MGSLEAYHWPGEADSCSLPENHHRLQRRAGRFVWGSLNGPAFHCGPTVLRDADNGTLMVFNTEHRSLWSIIMQCVAHLRLKKTDGDVIRQGGFHSQFLGVCMDAHLTSNQFPKLCRSNWATSCEIFLGIKTHMKPYQLEYVGLSNRGRR